VTFNPTEARDSTGKWISGGSDANADRQIEEARRMQLFARETAKEMGYDPDKVVVRPEDYKFELGGTQHSAAGTAAKDGTITLYSKNLSPGQIPEVMAHEIMHQKFHAFLADERAQRKLRDTDPVAFKSGEMFKHPITSDEMKPEYAEKYPLVHAMQQFQENLKDRAKEDGVTQYSADWWTDWEKGKVRTDQAIHETLAEMAAQKYLALQGKPTRRPRDVMGKRVFFLTGLNKRSPDEIGPPSHGGVSRKWAALYKTVNDNWESRK
jgi:hypothetical protein